VHTRSIASARLQDSLVLYRRANVELVRLGTESMGTCVGYYGEPTPEDLLFSLDLGS